MHIECQAIFLFPMQDQCQKSTMLVDAVIDNGTELVSNVRLAADHLQVQHRSRHEHLEMAMKNLLAKENKETNSEMDSISHNWPKSGYK